MKDKGYTKRQEELIEKRRDFFEIYEELAFSINGIKNTLKNEDKELTRHKKIEETIHTELAVYIDGLINSLDLLKDKILEERK